MALEAPFLLDTSALSRARVPSVRAAVEPLFGAGMVATCSVIDLEVGFSARSAADHSVLLGQRKYLPRAPINQETLDRALEVQGILASRGDRRVAIPDLLIAACAEENELTVVHYDKDFDIIARVTRQPTSWVVPRGTVS